MTGTPFAICTSHVNDRVDCMWMFKPMIEKLDIMKTRIQCRSTGTLIHGQLTEKPVYSLIIIHLLAEFEYYFYKTDLGVRCIRFAIKFESTGALFCRF